MSRPRITRTDVDPFGMGGMASAPTFPGTPEFSAHIERQESHGQQEFVHSEQFPAKAPIADLEALGFRFGPVDERDPLFRPAILPAGWTREGSDHAMWSYVLDDKRRRRVAIFYKAAFYDRDAFAHLVHPTAHLDELIYGDDVPTAVVLDERLTEQVARDYLLGELRQNEEIKDLRLAHYAPRAERLRLLLSLLPGTTEPPR